MVNLMLGLAMLQDDTSGGDAAAGVLGVVFGLGFMVVGLAFAAIMIVSMWKIFVKAGKPGWAAIVPIYNIIVMLEIIGKPLWWIALFCIPFVNFIAAIMMAIEMAKVFGKSTGFGLGLVFLPFIFYPMLAFGDARYSR